MKTVYLALSKDDGRLTIGKEVREKHTVDKRCDDDLNEKNFEFSLPKGNG